MRENSGKIFRKSSVNATCVLPKVAKTSGHNNNSTNPFVLGIAADMLNGSVMRPMAVGKHDK